MYRTFVASPEVITYYIIWYTNGFLLEYSSAIIKLDEDGSAQLTVSSCEIGQGIPGALDIREGRVFAKADPDKAVTVAEISSGAIYDYGVEGRHITATGKHQAIAHCPNFQAGFAEVEVDTETGVIRVLKFVVAHDIGRAINPLTVESCLEGGAY